MSIPACPSSQIKLVTPRYFLNISSACYCVIPGFLLLFNIELLQAINVPFPSISTLPPSSIIIEFRSIFVIPWSDAISEGISLHLSD